MAILYASLWVSSLKKYPIDYGISFNQNHATSLGLDWKEVYRSMLEDIKPKYIRIAAMWSEVEREKNTFDFADVDWMMNLAEENNAKVVLVVGQKAPRWPECHVPEWIGDYESKSAEDHLFRYITATVEKYKDHKTLEIWQVENEAFIKFKFGECEDYRSDLVEKEIKLVKSLDSEHKIMLTDSGELGTWKKPMELGDYFGTTLYRIVRTPGNRIFHYDWLPAAFYRWKAQVLGQDLNTFFVAELQAEPWFTDAGAENTSVEEQEETMNIRRLREHLDYASRIGTPRAYLWGVEWWYFMKEVNNDNRYWELIKEEINR